MGGCTLNNVLSFLVYLAPELVFSARITTDRHELRLYVGALWSLGWPGLSVVRLTGGRAKACLDPGIG